MFVVGSPCPVVATMKMINFVLGNSYRLNSSIAHKLTGIHLIEQRRANVKAAYSAVPVYEPNSI